MIEQWRDISGWEGFYQVSNLGRVKSLARTIPVTRRGWGPRRIRERVLMQQALPRYGHRLVTLQRTGVIQTLLVHRLVLTAFVGPCPTGMQCCHFPDRDPANNRLENLRWGTGVENMQDAREHGTLANINARRDPPTKEALAKRSASMKRVWAERKAKTVMVASLLFALLVAAPAWAASNVLTLN